MQKKILCLLENSFLASVDLTWHVHQVTFAILLAVLGVIGTSQQTKKCLHEDRAAALLYNDQHLVHVCAFPLT